MSADRDYKVGRGRPPKHTRFKKGDRANPMGRPKGSPNLATIIRRVAREKVTVNENGRRKAITKAEAAAKQLFNQAAGGDRRAIQLALELLDRLDRRAEAQPPVADAVSRKESDAEILKALKTRLTGDKSKDEDDGGED